MKPFIQDRSGFSLIELMVVVAIISILASLFTPLYFEHVKKAREGQCVTSRIAIQKASIHYLEQSMIPSGAPMPTLNDLVSAGYFSNEPGCSTSGIYVWSSPNFDIDNIPEIICSIH